MRFAGILGVLLIAAPVGAQPTPEGGGLDEEADEAILPAEGGALTVAAVRAEESDESSPTIHFEDGHTGEMVEIPRAWLEAEEWSAPIPEAEAPEGVPAINPESLAVVSTPLPRRWTPTTGADCQVYRRRRVCDGPLRVALPRGEAHRRAQNLGLGTDQAAHHLLGHGPTREWIVAARGASGPRRARTLRFPVQHGVVGRGVGMVSRRGGRSRRLHKGVDIGGAAGAPILSANDGIVAYAHNGVRGYGNLVMVVHPDATVTFYAHMQAVYVFPGMRVSRGQVLGELGSTGLSSGPHLHFEWRVDGQPRDPVPRFRAPAGTMIHR